MVLAPFRHILYNGTPGDPMFLEAVVSSHDEALVAEFDLDTSQAFSIPRCSLHRKKMKSFIALALLKNISCKSASE